MQLYYPTSFLKLVLIGIALVALPLLFVLLSIAVSVERLVDQSQQAVYQAAQATQVSRRLTELVGAMERNARQYLILGDPGMLESYRANRNKLLQAAESFSALPFDNQQQADLAELLKREQQVFRALANPSPSPAEVKAAASEFVELSNLAQAMMMRSNELIDAEVDALRKIAGNARAILVWQLIALMPVLLFLVIGFTMLVVRPIRQIDSAIRRLGEGQFSAEIVVNGPQDLQYLGRQLDWMRRRLIELEEQRNRFLRHMSHQLKTPLTALREGAELLADGTVGALGAEQREIAEILRHNSVELQRLIEDLLNYAALQFHKLALVLGPVDVRAILEKVLEAHKVALKAKSIRVEMQCDAVALTADADKLRMVVDNLLSNAIKFSPEGGAIRLSMQQRNDQAVLDVVDQGPGISAEDRPRVFDPFFQGTAAQDTRVKGTGLGLSIVKEYVAAHRGNVEVIDTTGQGAHLRVTLPIALGSANAQLS